MSTIICGQRPLVLKKIDPLKIATDYKNGNFSKVSLKNLIRIPKEIMRNNDISAKVTASTIVRLNRNNTVTKVVLAKRDDGKKICSECGYSFSGDGFGTPIKLFQFLDEKGVTNRQYTLQGNIDTLECAIKATKRLSSTGRRGIDANYIDSYSLLNLLAYDLFKVSLSECKEAPPRELADINGGPMSREEYQKNSHAYKPVINISVIRTPSQYLQV